MTTQSIVSLSMFFSLFRLLLRVGKHLRSIIYSNQYRTDELVESGQSVIVNVMAGLGEVVSSSARQTIKKKKGRESRESCGPIGGEHTSQRRRRALKKVLCRLNYNQGFKAFFTSPPARPHLPKNSSPSLVNVTASDIKVYSRARQRKFFVSRGGDEFFSCVGAGTDSVH